MEVEQLAGKRPVAVAEQRTRKVWLNMAESELSVLKGQCLDRRIPDLAIMQTQVVAWERDRNNSVRTIVWQFTANRRPDQTEAPLTEFIGVT